MRTSSVRLVTMRRRDVLIATVALAVTVTPEAAPAPVVPSERSCLLAWNAPGNLANRMRVAGGRPWSSASLRAGTTSTVTWSRGKKTETTSPACLMALVARTRLQLVTGVWRERRLVRWSFARPIPAEQPPFGANVRVLTDGRVTKVYRR